MVEILVQLDERRSIRVVRCLYYVVCFDEAGRLDTTRFQEQQWALAESVMDRVFTVPGDDDRVLDAASTFVAQGGQWRPSHDLAQRIDDMALGRRSGAPAQHAIDDGRAAIRRCRQSAISRR